MKRMTSVFIATVMFAAAATVLSAEEYGAYEYSETVASVADQVRPTVETPTVSNQESSSEAESSDGDIKCFRGYRWYRSCYYYYTPVVYYYRPVVTYWRWTYSYRYSYTYRYISFYKSMSAKSATNENGILIEETPNSGTPLASLGIVKGDIITTIDGTPVTHPSQLDKITATSDVKVIRSESNTAATAQANNSVAPERVESQTAEYGAFEY